MPGEKKSEQKVTTKIEKIKSGVPGLDELMFGGIPKGNLVVLSGDQGSGKTVLCWQFLFEGAVKYGENGVYVSLEENEESIYQGSKEFGWDLKKLVDERKLIII